jgi:calcineurin-like phosphoesterase family protein
MRFDHFYSDPHFGHAKIIEYCDRPFKDEHHQSMSLMARYNLIVRPGDNVLWLGDCFFGHTDEEMGLVLEQLHGTKTLVCGNHDRASRRMAAVGFEFVTKQLVWQQDGRTFRGSHFPWKNMMGDEGNLTRHADQRYPQWHPKYNKNEVLVHGHTHDPRKHNGGNAVHCGVDAHAFAPVSALEVNNILETNGF